jgi:5-methylcytosine-specific restriction protein B
VPPRPEVLANIEVEGVRLDALLQAINRRLERLRDRDHLIGHAFFVPLEADPTLAHLRRIFRNAILPLLQEYFYDDLRGIGLVLGPRFVKREPADDVFARGFDHELRDDLAERPVWRLCDVDGLDAEAFRSIHA